VVYGGGGIVPDILAGDSVNAPRVALFAALGPNIRAFRDALTAEARALAQQGIADVMFTVTPTMRDAVYTRARRQGIDVPRPAFDAASDWVDRQLGGEAVRYAFSRAEESRRQVLRDRVVQRAVTEISR
jgi:hypothetical protein